MIERALYRRMWEELSADKPMIFLAGPRQAGKTTFAKWVAQDYSSSLYTNWDQHEDRRRILKDPRFFRDIPRKGAEKPLVIFDEIHKYRGWKNYLKGIYDEFHEDFRFLVTGSGRLDIFQRGGDSLAGRYLLFHLWPLTLSEFCNARPDLESWLRDPLALADSSDEMRSRWNRLLSFGGFPEPHIKGLARSWRRWSQIYHRQLLREDMQEIGGLANVQAAEDLFVLLPERVGSPLSLNALSEVIGVSPHTVKRWIELFERFFLSFRISPWTRKLSRAIVKEKKLYLFDTPLVKDAGARFENAVALELNRAVRSWSEMGYGQFALHYVRNKDKQEVDFLIAKDREPILLIETKMSARSPAPALLRFQEQLGVPALQLVCEGDDTYRRWSDGGKEIQIAPAWRWLAHLP